MDYYKLIEKGSVTPEKMVKILAANGTVVSIESAGKILESIHELSNLSMKETLAKIPKRNIRANRKIFKRHTRRNANRENS